MNERGPRTLLDPKPSQAETTLRGTVQSVVFQSDDGKFSVIVLLGVDGREARVVGDLGGVKVAESVRVTGRFETSPTRGQQFRASLLVPELPTTVKGIEALLASGYVDGIGAAMAKRIVSRFGAGTLDVISEQPERLREIPGVGKQRVKKIREAFDARRAETEARSFLQAAGLGPALTRNVIRAYGDRTVAIVREDPYRMAREIHGVGFRTADAIAQQVGIPRDDPRRAAGAILHVVSEGSDQGHTALPLGVLRDQLRALEVPEDPVEGSIAKLVTERALVIEDGLAYVPALHRAETYLARRLARIEADGVAAIGAKALQSQSVQRALEPLNTQQRDAVRAIAETPLLVLTGGPGTGKTTTVRAIVALANAANLEIALASPTGRAARRLSEATGQPASTVHRLLEWNPRLARFNRGEESPLLADVVLVDEASMLDVVLASRIVAALKPHARLVLVGDSDQLPSVGPGTVLADLLATKWIASVRLTEVFRQAAESAIVRAAHDILQGRVPRPSPARARGVKAPPGGELFRVAIEDAEQGAELLVRTVAERIPDSFGIDPRASIQVLVPTHKGPLGAQALNRGLQRALNPPPAGDSPQPDDAPVRLRVGDKVMQLRNDYEREVWNGDIGIVREVARDATFVTFDGRDVKFDGDSRDALVLAYAATVHKAQGSEYDAVVIGLHTSHFMLLQRALLYTAVTRARRLAVIVGSERALRMAIDNTKTAARFGALGSRLRAISE